MRVRYEGPPDQVDHEVGAALAAQREDESIELPDERPGAEEGATLHATSTPDASALLEPGRVYNLPQELAEHLAATSAWWERVDDYSKLPHAELKKIAAERGVEGRSKMSKDELVAAIRATPDESPPAEPDASPQGGASPPGGETTTGVTATTTAPAAPAGGGAAGV